MNSKKLMTFALFGTIVFLACIYAIQGALLTDTINFYHPESSAQGYAGLFSSFGAIIALVSAFFLIGRIPKIHLLLIGLIISSGFICLLSLPESYVVYIFFWFLAGIGMGYIDCLVSSCVADLYTGREATKMMCNLHMTFGIGSMLAPVAIAFLKNVGVKWRNLYYLLAFLGFIMIILLFISDKTGKRISNENIINSENKMTLKDMAEKIREGALPYLIIAMFFHGLFMGGMNSWLTHYVSVTLASKFGSIALSFMYLGVLLSRFIVPRTSIPVRKYLSKAGIFAGIIFIIAIPFKSGIIMCIAVVLSTLCFGAMIPCSLDTACADMPDSTLFATTIIFFCIYIGQGLSSPILGAIEKGIGLQYGMYLIGIFMIIASLILNNKKVVGS